MAQASNEKVLFVAYSKGKAVKNILCKLLHVSYLYRLWDRSDEPQLNTVQPKRVAIMTFLKNFSKILEAFSREGY